MTKVYTHISGWWDGAAYVTDEEHSTWYAHGGDVARCCGASGAQTAIGQQQQTAYSTMTAQAGQVFGDSSSVFQDLNSTFAPTVAAGPNQQGFSPAELSNLNSAAITDTGQAYRNAKSAVGEAESAQGGGNTPDVTGGAKVGTDLGIAEGAANQTSSELSQIGEANYETGRKNYEFATAGLANAPNVFGAADSANNTAINAGNAAENTANQIATQSNSWVQGVTGALGAIGGAAASAGIGKLGGSSTNPGISGSSAQAISQAAGSGSSYTPVSLPSSLPYEG